MKAFPILLFAVAVASGQSPTGSIQGVLLDSGTQRPVPAAVVIANRAGVPPFTRNTRSGADGAFQIQGLPAGDYRLCVQVEGDQYLDPCQWSTGLTTVTLPAGQAASGISLRVTAASVLYIQAQDPQNILSQKTADGRPPDLSVGVWGANGLYYPAHRAGSLTAGENPLPGMPGHSYQLAVPRDTALQLQIASHDLRLGDAAGAALPANTSTQSFQLATGGPDAKSFTFTVLGLLP